MSNDGIFVCFAVESSSLALLWKQQPPVSELTRAVTHQFPHAWFDFRNKHDAFGDYFENSAKATQAYKAFCLSLTNQFPNYTDDLWGITAFDSVHGYVAWGEPPATGPLDGIVLFCAAGRCLPFLYADCMKVLRNIRGRYSTRA